MDVFCVFSFVCFLLSSRLRSSAVSVVFDFNASLNDVAPLSSIQLPLNRNNEPSELFMDIFMCLLSFLKSSPHMLSLVSVVFDFNASLNDVAPDPPIVLSIG